MDKKILIVDDDLQIREMFRKLFSHKGYNALTASTSGEAIGIIKKENPDLTLLDIKMPDPDGMETLKKLRAEGVKTKIVMLTGKDDLELEKQARLNGASGFLRKHLGLDIILKAVDEFFGENTESEKKSGRKIMVVDDSPEIRALLENFLSKKEYQPIIAASAEEALEKIEKEKPSIVLLDVKMPGMDGLSALKRIKEINRQIGVVMITGVGDEKIAQEAIRLGAFDYIVKPFDLEYLETCLLTTIVFSGL